MKNQVIATTLLFASLAAIGCAQSKSSDLMAPPPVFQADSATSGGLQFEFNPKVDILFVIDNSESMADELAQLQKASDKFVENFGENSLIDYRVGVISVYDSRRCGKKDAKSGKIVECYPEGKLQPLKSENSAVDVAKLEPFVTRFDGAKDVLRASLNIGALPMEKGGPRFEELYSPILKALGNEQNRANGNFIRKDSTVVIVMVTDEDDSSSRISNDAFLYQLDSLVGLHRTELYAVVATDKSATTVACQRQSYADAPDRLVSVVEQVEGKGHVYSICDGEKFGAGLATIGENICKRALSKKIILNSIPEAATLKLFYGDVEIPVGQGWSYDPNSNTISINEDIQLTYVPDAKFSVQYTRFELSKLVR